MHQVSCVAYIFVCSVGPRNAQLPPTRGGGAAHGDAVPHPVRLPEGESGVNRGQREHNGSFSGYPPKGGGAVFS